MRQRVVLVIGIILLVCFFCYATAFCQDEEKERSDSDIDSIEAVIELLKEKGVINDEEASTFIQRHKKKSVSAEEARKAVTIIPEDKEKEFLRKIKEDVTREITDDIQSKVKEEIKDEIVQAAKHASRTPSVPGWVERIRWGGDIRLRYQRDLFGEKNYDMFFKPSAPNEWMNTTENRQRCRIRVRFGMTAEVNENMEVGLRLLTGNEDDPVSDNRTLGDSFNNDGIVLERAYLKWSPIPEIAVWGGRIPNPWFYSNLVWDHDLTFEGLAINVESKEPRFLGGFLNAGVFPLQEVELSQRDKWLLGGQVGIKINPSDKLCAKIGVAYYDYQNITGEVNDPARPHEKDWTAPQYQQKGNTLMDIDPSESIRTALASDYDELDIMATLDIGVFDPVHVILLGDYVKNIGFDKDEVSERAGQEIPKETDAYHVGLSVGYPKVREWGAWKTYLFYKRIEADAVLDAYTDSDFHLGGTNTKGWIFGGELGLYKNCWLSARWLTADAVKDPEVIDPERSQLVIDVFQFDLKVEF